MSRRPERVARTVSRSLALAGTLAAVSLGLACGGPASEQTSWPTATIDGRAPALAPSPAEVPATDAGAISTSAPDAAPGSTPAIAVPAIAQRPATLDQLSIPAKVAPIEVRIEGQRIDAPIVAVSADVESGELAIPPRHEVAGWYEHSSTPGEVGSAVLAAHVDWDGQLGVFYRLREVPVGATVAVRLEDGREVRFTVDSVEEIPKTELPLDRVFRREGDPQLVLITCGGAFDRASRHYADNIVVFATPLHDQGAPA